MVNGSIKRGLNFDSPLKNAALDRRSACEKHPTGSTRWRYEDSSRPRESGLDVSKRAPPLDDGTRRGNSLGLVNYANNDSASSRVELPVVEFAHHVLAVAFEEDATERFG